MSNNYTFAKCRTLITNNFRTAATSFSPWLSTMEIDGTLYSKTSSFTRELSVFLKKACFFSTQMNKETLNIFEEVTTNFDSHSTARRLQQCVVNGVPNTGMSLHCDILKKGNCLDLFAWNVLLNMYVKLDLLSHAITLFDEMPERNTISFVTMIQGYVQSLRFVEALDLFLRLHREGHELNPFVFTTILKLLVSMESAEMSWRFHACIYKLGHVSNTFVATALIDSYSVSGFVNVAEDVFDSIIDKDMVSWTGMIGCYSENGYFEQALQFFSQMRCTGLKPNNYTFASVIKACLGLEAHDIAQGVHACTLKMNYEVDPYVGPALLELYSRCGEDMDDVEKVFNEIPEKDVVSWSFMIARYSQNNRSNEAIEVFRRMQGTHFVLPNQFTFTSLLQACANTKNLELGSQIHTFVMKVGLDSVVFVSNALMDVYAKCGRIEISMKLFRECTNTNEVSWNTIIVGYVSLGDGEMVLSLFLNMLRNRIHPTEVTYSTVVRACAGLASMETGSQLHSLTVKTLYNLDSIVANSLIDMYGKCGSIVNAQLVFDEMNEQDIVSWNTMISVYSMHGRGDEALKTFERMKKIGCKPNKTTFIGVLSACTNTGLLEKGEEYFTSMVKDYNIEPSGEHYTCMVGLFGRCRLFDKAVKLIREIPFEPNVSVWRALLSSCVVHKEIEVGLECVESLLRIMDPEDDGSYVLVSNMYAIAKKWDEVRFVRESMKRKGVKKEPGLSWIEYQGIVHYFSVGGKNNNNNNSDYDTRLIHGMLVWLKMKVSRAGFVPNCDVVLLDVDDNEKSNLLWMHSERLALAFALVRTPSGSLVRIIKNLRICLDCHAVMKFVSKVVDREIVVRDVNRFHHFRDGICSCNDYW
ncbi:putative pentatricopeptide repeat-containing protein At5g13230, mitochondrial [Impatiens glandulifera]|uniref:putative pentatricopeptide repeat-containing protein At5g13230, mitochondrial n=1 Tax=Impatiens glandulifera TaxID=253017 RepID=UPI001FB04F43|nr:putative pentatricopeptide repeat-containing protein At5g13230, mitochondrial [Impatiens glandulifera]